MHDDNSLDSGHYFSSVIDVNTGICWHCYDYEITLISDFPEGVYNIENCKKKDTEKKLFKAQKSYY